MTHLSDNELARWRDHGDPKDRDRVLGHLATCDDCRQRLADLVRSAPASATQTSFDPAPFIRRGQQVFEPRRRSPASTLWLGLGGLLVAAASLFIVLRPGVPAIPPVEIRGSELLGISPAGPASSVTEFRWSSPFAASRYRVVVRDASAAIVLQLESAGESAPVDAASQAKLVPGAYQWTVEALDATRAIVAASKPQAFTIGR